MARTTKNTRKKSSTGSSKRSSRSGSRAGSGSGSKSKTSKSKGRSSSKTKKTSSKKSAQKRTKAVNSSRRGRPSAAKSRGKEDPPAMDELERGFFPEALEGESADAEDRGAVRPKSRGKEVAGVLLLAAALLSGTSLASLQFGDGDLMGPFGRAVALGLYAILGMAGYLVVLAMGLMSLRYLAMVRKRSDWLMWLGYAGATALSAVIIHCMYPDPRLHGFTAGGKTGEILGEFLLALFSSAGTYLVAIVGLVICLMLATDISLIEAVVGLSRLVRAVVRGTAYRAKIVGSFLRRTFSWKAEPALAAGTTDGGSLSLSRGSTEEAQIQDNGKGETEGAAFAAEEPEAMAGGADEANGEIDETAPSPASGEGPEAAAGEKLTENKDEGEATSSANGARGRGPAPRLPKIVERKKAPQKKTSPDKALQIKPIDSSNYELPPLDLLAEAEEGEKDTDQETMLALAKRLEATLQDYGILGRIREIHPGPVVTMYEFAPERGTKLSKITALSSDLAMSMEATKVRIVAPIPGKNAVGIEIPNHSRETVYLREMLEDAAFYKGTPKLRMALGKNINGESTFCDMAKAPHMLIAGATGAGKSVGVHAMILSLLYQYTPEDLRLLLIDPKMLEFSCYHDIPHLLHPVVTDPQQANLALRWAVEEMESRYQKLAELGVRNLDSFNRKVERLLKEKKEREEKEALERSQREEKTAAAATQTAESPGSEDAEDAEVKILEEGDLEPAAVASLSSREGEDKPPLQKLPFVVVVIDEFADLMMASPKEVETSVARIAQKARAAGIHLVVATQRPSTDVITGLIRANFPTRVAYQVSSKVDSRVVLEQHGAESLLGMGDMLFSNRGLTPSRAHGPFVSTEEIDDVVAHVKEQARPNYNMEIVKPLPENDADEDEQADPKYDQAVAIVAAQRNASISFLQRKLRVGYNRAARMIEMMEKEGVVGPSDGVKGREVLVGSMED